MLHMKRFFQLNIFKRFKSSESFKNKSTENDLKNGLIEWINKKHSNKGDDFIKALEIVKGNAWDVLSDYTKNQWKTFTNKPFLGFSIYNQINKMKPNQSLTPINNEKTLQTIAEDLQLKNSLIEWINENMIYIQYKERALAFLNENTWDIIYAYDKKQWMTLGDYGGLMCYYQINELKTKREFTLKNNKPPLKYIDQDLLRKNSLIEWINNNINNPKDEPLKVKALDFIHNSNWFEICKNNQNQWITHSGSIGIGIPIYNEINQIRLGKCI